MFPDAADEVGPAFAGAASQTAGMALDFFPQERLLAAVGRFFRGFGRFFGLGGKGAGVGSSLYDDVTRAGSRVANRATDVTKSQFEKNLMDSGFTRSLSRDGKAIILEKDGAKYILRDGAKSTGGPTADFYKAGSTSADMKIRLKQGAP